MTYTFDNYTNTGIQTTTALNKNWFFQLGVSIGTEALPWHWGQQVQNPFPNVVFPGNEMLRDPGAVPAIAAGIRWQSDDAKDNIYIVGDGINSGIWGYNNLQWTGITWYHIINDQWHFSWETYTLGMNKVLNAADPDHILANSGWPFSPEQGFAFNAPGTAQCSSPYVVTCNARSFASVMYINYRIDGLNNISFREEFFNDMQGQRTGVKTRYLEFGIGWQHWLSPQIEFRPEVTYYYSMDANAFNGNANAAPNGAFAIAPDRNYALVGAMDLIWHF
jgi:hypothetical protein